MVQCLPVPYLVLHCSSFTTSKTFCTRRRRSFSPSLFSTHSSFSRLQCSLVASPPSLPAEYVEFIEASKTGNIVPLFRCIFSDHLTPVLAYRCLVKENDWETPSFLFDSFEQGHQDSILGRYSIVGCEPSVEIVAKERRVIVTDHRQGQRTEMLVKDPMGVPQRIMEGWTPQLTHQLPDTFCGKFLVFSLVLFFNSRTTR